MMARGVESAAYSQPVCSAGLAAAMLRRASSEPILTTPPVRATQPWSLWPMCVKTFSQETNIQLFSGHEPLKKSNKNFPLEPRAKTQLRPLLC